MRECHKEEANNASISLQASFYKIKKFTDEFSIFWVFFSRTKRTEVLRRYSELSIDFDSNVKSVKMLMVKFNQITYQKSEMKNIFFSDTTKFIVEIESILKKHRSNLSNHTFEAVSYLGSLPKEIVDAVNKVQLELKTLKSTLRPYQIFGTKYLINQKKTLLGDDMGLGKTMQVLAAMCHLSNALKLKRFLVVVPNSVLINWQREAKKHTGFLTYVIHGKIAYENLSQWLNKGGIGITTYNFSNNLLSKINKIDFLAVDEAHAIKNPKAQRTQSIALLSSRSEYTCYMTGTAIENRLTDMLSILVNLNPRLKEVFEPLQNEINPTPVKVRKSVAVAYLRRQQKDVLKELPEIIQIEEPVELTSHERTLYQNSPSDVANQRLSAIVGAGDGKSSKYYRLQEIVETYLAEDKKIVVFSFFRNVLNDVCKIIPGAQQINGSLNMTQRQSIIDSFFEKKGFAAIVLQIDAGGQGINLQCAHAVILMEPQLKPSTENQAIARVMRMGQVNTVTVHRLYAIDTIDERLMSLIREKELIFEDYAAKSEIHLVSTEKKVVH